MAQKVGFIGLGRMGRPFATNILKAGFDVMVYDIQPQPVAELVKLGAKAASSAREVAEYADIVDVAVRDRPNAPDVERGEDEGEEGPLDTVMHGPDGLLAGAHPGLIAIIHAAVHPDHMKRVAEEAKAKGVDILDAQMSGGTRGVEAQTLCLMVGGEPEVLDTCRPVLETTGANIFHLGGVGMGAVAKIVQNTITAMHVMAAAEGFRLAEKAGLDLEVLQDVIRVSAAQSHVADSYLHGRGRNDGRWPYFPILWNALDLAHTYDISLPGAATCMQALAYVPRIGGAR